MLTTIRRLIRQYNARRHAAHCARGYQWALQQPMPALDAYLDMALAFGTWDAFDSGANLCYAERMRIQRIDDLLDHLETLE